MFNKIKNLKRCYVIHKTGGRSSVCKVLNEYDSQEEAEKELMELLSHNKTEADLLKEFAEKPL